VGSDEPGGIATRGDGQPPPAPLRLALLFAVVVMLLALPIVGHGCHRGDHDDEPVFAPMDQHAEPPR
jgi:hypothetical protein